LVYREEVAVDMMAGMLWMLLWAIIGAALLAALVVGIVWAARNARPSGGAGVPTGRDDAEEILRRRYAQGEIDEAEYTRRLDDLRRR
jgi:putative membrane protein